MGERDDRHETHRASLDHCSCWAVALVRRHLLRDAISGQPPPRAGNAGSIWAFTAAGLLHLRGDGNPMTFNVDDPLYVVDGAHRRHPEDKDGWEDPGVRDYNAAALSKLGYFVLMRDDSFLPTSPIRTPGYSLHLVPIPNVPTTEPNTATRGNAPYSTIPPSSPGNPKTFDARQ